MIIWPVTLVEDKYSKWYELLITKAQDRKLDKSIYCEVHHIVPRSFGGENNQTNLVALTAKEHYIAHALLWKMKFEPKYHSKMSYALRFMIFGAGTKKQLRNYKSHSRIYESVRVEFSQYHSKNMSGENNSFYGKKHTQASINKALQTKKETGNHGYKFQPGHKLSQESIKKISIANTGRTWEMNVGPEKAAELKKQMAERTRTRFLGKHLSEETRKKISEKATGRPSPFKGTKGLRKFHPDAAAKRIATRIKNGTLVGSPNPLVFRGVEYRNYGEAARATNKTKYKIKTEIKNWGSNPSDDIKQKIDCGELKFIPYNKGVPMSEEQKQKLSLLRIQNGRTKGELNGRALTVEFKDPDQNTFVVKGGFRKFCDQYGLPHGTMIAVAKGRKEHWNNWHVKYL
jgi:hypothetical protein